MYASPPVITKLCPESGARHFGRLFFIFWEAELLSQGPKGSSGPNVSVYSSLLGLSHVTLKQEKSPGCKFGEQLTLHNAWLEGKG